MSNNGNSGKILIVDDLDIKKRFATGGFSEKGKFFICQDNTYEREEVVPKEKSNVMGKCNIDMKTLENELIKIKINKWWEEK